MTWLGWILFFLGFVSSVVLLAIHLDRIGKLEARLAALEAERGAEKEAGDAQ